MTLEIEDAERFADPLDHAAQAEEDCKSSNIDSIRRLAAPEQDGTQTECSMCGNDLGERAKLGKIRCISCQERIEKRRGGYA